MTHDEAVKWFESNVQLVTDYFSYKGGARLMVTDYEIMERGRRFVRNGVEQVAAGRVLKIELADAKTDRVVLVDFYKFNRLRNDIKHARQQGRI